MDSGAISKSTALGCAALAFAAGAGCVWLLQRRCKRPTFDAGYLKGALAPSSGDALVPVGAPLPTDISVVAREDKYVGKWIKFSTVSFIAPSRMQQPCHWERVERTTTAADVDGADAFAVVRRPGAADQVILLLSYRAAVESVTVELPAGLVDKGESAETSAVRELQEETGYVGRPLRVSGKQWTDPWKSTETCRMVFIEVDGEAPENRNPVPRRESEELQQVLLVPVRQLQSALNHLEESKGYLIDARLRCLAIGLALCPRMFR